MLTVIRGRFRLLADSRDVDADLRRTRTSGRKPARAAESVCYDLRVLRASLVLVVATAVVAPARARADAAPTPWSSFRAPTKHAAQAIGGYSAGCIDGAIALGTS